MALPSQMERTAEMSRPIMTRGGGRRFASPSGKLVLGVVSLVVLAGAVWGISHYFNADTGPAKAGAEPAPLTQNKPTPPPPNSLLGPNAPRPGTPTPAGHQPMTLVQGAQQPSTQPSTPTQTTPPASNPTKPTPVDVTRPDLKAPAAQPTGPGTPPPPAPSTGGGPGTLAPTGSASAVVALIDQGDRALHDGKGVEARAAWSRALLHPDATKADQESLRAKLTTLNEDMVFSNKVTPGDSLVEQYSVQSGDSLVKIAKRRDLAVDWRFIQRINRISSPGALKVGQKLKLVRGPFHAVVHRDDFRLDLFAGSPGEPNDWLYVRSFKVGLGDETKNNSTPLGTFVVKRGSKLVNPPWVNPRTGEKFGADDPKNPIGEYWIGLEGQGDAAINRGYGLHGTIEPDSIGQQRSMGCVRMLPDDIAMMYEVLTEQVSVVKIVP